MMLTVTYFLLCVYEEGVAVIVIMAGFMAE